ncbi:MAG: integrase core domain-containing protein, partial [Treponema sp.]|nr:integrase core domain-containing protein [Treponema sp.]
MARQSMSRKGNYWDNAGAESLFKTLKRELETLDGKHSAGEVRQLVFMYIQAYYNRVRLHSGLDYAAPDGFTSGHVVYRYLPNGVKSLQSCSLSTQTIIPEISLSIEPVPKLIDCALKRTVLDQALA